MTHKEKIEKAVDNLIDSWDMDTLVNFAVWDRVDHYLHWASEKEVEWLLQDFGGEE